MKKIHAVVLILLVSVVVSFSYIYWYNLPLQVKIVQMNVTVSNDGFIGLNADPAFYFGSMGPGQGGTRYLDINQITRDVRVSISTEGEMSEWVGYSDNLIVRKGEDIRIPIHINIPGNASFGHYSGTATIILRKA